MAIPKFLQVIAGQITEVFAGITASTGATDANKVIVTDVNGKLDSTFLPTGIGADTQTITASEAISAGNLVNVWNNAGVYNIRKADATIAGKEAHGFVKTAIANGSSGLVYFEGNNDAVTGVSPGKLYLSTTAGGFTTTAPSGSGNIVQEIGFGTQATNINFQYSRPIVLA